MKRALIIISYQHYTHTPITLSDLIILSQNVCLSVPWSVPIYQIPVSVVGVKNAGMIIFTFFIELYNCEIICYDANTIVSGLIV